MEGARLESEVITCLKRARLFALACTRDPEGGSDNLPTVIMEAMAAGLPIVSTRVAGIPEMIDDGRTGRLLAEHDVAGLAAAMEGLLKDAAAAMRQGEAGRAAVEQKFSTGRTTSALKHLLTRRTPVWPPLKAMGGDPRLLGDVLGRLAGLK